MRKTIVYSAAILSMVFQAYGQWSPPSSTNFITTTHVNGPQDYGLNLETSGGNYRYFIENNLTGINQQVFYFGHSNGSKNIFGISASGNSGSTWTPHFVINHNGKTGIGTNNPLSKVHISNRTSGQNPHGFADLSIEDSDHVMISLMTSNIKNAYIGFADTDDAFVGGIQYDHPNDIMYFRVNDHVYDMVINKDGNVGIGTTVPGSYRLAVNGKIHAKEVKVDLTGWPDYVFKEEYDLPTFEAVKQHIKEKGHLINIPSAKEVEENGIELGEMNKLFLKKIEELTLYTLDLRNQLKEQDEKLGQVEELELALGVQAHMIEELRKEIKNLQK